MIQQPKPHIDEVWQTEAIKSGGPALVAIIQYLKDGQEAMLGVCQEQSKVCTMLEARMEAFLEAFPARDSVGHRRYHEAIIEHLEWKKRFYRDMIEHLAKGGLWALAVFIVGCIALGLKKWWISA